MGEIKGIMQAVWAQQQYQTHPANKITEQRNQSRFGSSSTNVEKKKKKKKKKKMGMLLPAFSSPQRTLGRIGETGGGAADFSVGLFGGLKPHLAGKKQRSPEVPMVIKKAGMGKVGTRAAPKREKDPKKRVVVTGMGVVSVFGNDVDAFYDKLLAGESGIGLIDRFDTSRLPVRFAGQIRGFSSEGYGAESTTINVDDANLDDLWRYCLLAGRKALRHSGLDQEALPQDRSRIGVVVGSGSGGVGTFKAAVDSLMYEGYEKISPSFIPLTITNMGSALLAMEMGLMGPNYSISSACGTANFCLYAAANHVRSGEADVMLAGGTESPIFPYGIGAFTACRALSQRNHEPTKASRPWDKDRDGFVLGEGAGVLVMESLAHARSRGAEVVAEILGGAITCDAYHMTNPRSDGLVVSSCILKSLEDAGVSPEEVNYVNAHATSTPAGDLAELSALNYVFSDTSEMRMNSTKSIIGHGLGAAGALEAIATIKAITTGWLHPTLNQYNLEPEVNIDTVPNTKQKHEVHVGISNSFGFGGQNSVVVFSPFIP